MLDKIYSSISDYLQSGQENILQNRKLIDMENIPDNYKKEIIYKFELLNL